MTEAELVNALTPRERDILRRMALFGRREEIAASAGISMKTLEVHTASIYRKLRIDHIVHAAVIAAKAGLV